MKKQIIGISIIICMLCLVILPTLAKGVEAATDLADNELLILNGKTITKTTTISQVNAMFGEPKVETASAFGGKAYSYYDDAYTYYMYLETNASGAIKAYGAIGGNFKGKRFAQDAKVENSFSFLTGLAIENYGESTAMGMMEYNCDYNEANDYWTAYEKKDSEYLYGLQKHCIPASKVVGTKYDEAFVQTYASEDIFFRNEQLKDNGSDFNDFAEKTGKTESIQFISKAYSNQFYRNLPNPISFGRSTLYYPHAENFAYALYDINITDYAQRKYNSTVVFIDPSCLEPRKKIELTSEEQAKLAAAQEQYKIYREHLAQTGSDLYEVKPNYTTLPLNAGKYKSIVLQTVTDYLNIARAGLGIGTLAMNEEIADCAQHKATLVYYMNNNGMDAGHFPVQPEGVSDEFYNKAQSYMNENLYTGDIQRSITHAINDGYGDPVTCGHRYNLIYPGYTQWGIGSVGSGISFGWQSAHKFSGYTDFENELVAWPSNGIVPIEFISGGIGNWTAKFYKKYTVTPDTEVSVKCLNTDKTYEITKETVAGSSTKMLRVTTGENMVTFRDDSITYEHGDVMEITIKNVKDANGNLVDYTYRTVFNSFFQSSGTPVESLQMDKVKVNLAVGGQEKVNVIAIPENASNKMMNFTSEDSSVAIVRQDGLITAVGEGTTTIQVACGDIKETIEVVVQKALKGDVNKDGYVRLYDAFKILEQAILGGDLSAEEVYIMDYNDDGKVALYDAFKFLEQAILG